MYEIRKNIFRSFVGKLSQIDWLLILSVLFIAGISFLTLYSLDSDKTNYVEKHFLRFTLSIIILFVVASINIKFWYKTSYWIYALVLISLLLVDFIGLVSKGSKRWLDVGPVNLQPSEVMKIAVIMALAKYYQYLKTDDVDKPSKLALPIALIILPFLIVVKQPDLGTALFILIVSISILWLAGLNLKIFTFGALSILVLAPLSISFLKPYQKNRILTFLDPDKDPTGAGYHVTQSKIAIGSGGFFGKGFMEGSQTKLAYLPEPHTDFIFTAFAEQFGFVGCLILILLFIFLISRINKISNNSRSNFGRLLCFGIAFNFFAYVGINIGMVTGILPVVGVPIPIMSYGGTAMITTMFSLGLVLSTYIHRDENIL